MAGWTPADADAPHARLDAQMHLHRPALPHCFTRQCLGKRQLADDLRDRHIDDVPRALLQHESQEKDRHGKSRTAQLCRLAERRDGKIRGACRNGDACRRDRPVPVGIVF